MVEADKILHFIFSYTIAISSYLIIPNLLTATIVTLFIGILKEIYDINKTGFSTGDLIANAIGIICAILFVLTIKFFK